MRRQRIHAADADVLCESVEGEGGDVCWDGECADLGGLGSEE